jgi:hypothetical protein
MSIINDCFGRVQVTATLFFLEFGAVPILSTSLTLFHHSTIVLYNVLHCSNLSITLLHCPFFLLGLSCLLSRFFPAVPCTVLLFPALCGNF